MSDEKKLVEINPDVATSKTKAFFNRHKTKMIVGATTVGAATMFVLGRKSNELVESVDVDINLADADSQD